MSRATTLDALFREDVRQQQEAEKAAKAKVFKPMLSATCEDASTLKYPVLVSPKLDGIRCIIRGGVAVSRNLKPIPNKYIQQKLKGLPDGLDGELIVGKPTGEDVWNRSQSGVMSADGEPDFTYHVFDFVHETERWRNDPFDKRLAEADAVTEDFGRVDIVRHFPCTSLEELEVLEEGFVNVGYEGAMIRDPKGVYKFGRSTVKEGGLLKLKRWHDAEAIVVDMVERMHNANEATKDELGRTKRSTHKANKVGRGDMGALVCTMDQDKSLPIISTFELGTGFTDEERKTLWEGGAIGKVVTFKYQALTPDGLPRFPVFKGFRAAQDMSA